MDTQLLLSGEEILTESNDKTITLTNYRIRYYETRFGHASLASIHLDKLSAIEMKYKSNLLFLYLGVLAIIAGFIVAIADEHVGDLLIGIIPGIVLFVFYWLTKHHVVHLSSDSGVKIEFKTKGMKNETIVAFINQIEQARQNYIQKL